MLLAVITMAMAVTADISLGVVCPDVVGANLQQQRKAKRQIVPRTVRRGSHSYVKYSETRGLESFFIRRLIATMDMCGSLVVLPLA